MPRTYIKPLTTDKRKSNRAFAQALKREVGLWVKARRKAMGLHKTEVAKMAGLTYPSYLAVEDPKQYGSHLRRGASLDTMAEVVDALGARLEFVLRDKNDKR